MEIDGKLQAVMEVVTEPVTSGLQAVEDRLAVGDLQAVEGLQVVAAVGQVATKRSFI